MVAPRNKQKGSDTRSASTWVIRESRLGPRPVSHWSSQRSTFPPCLSVREPLFNRDEPPVGALDNLFCATMYVRVFVLDIYPPRLHASSTDHPNSPMVITTLYLDLNQRDGPINPLPLHYRSWQPMVFPLHPEHLVRSN